MKSWKAPAPASGRLIQTIPHKKEHPQHITQLDLALAAAVEATIEAAVKALLATVAGAKTIDAPIMDRLYSRSDSILQLQNVLRGTNSTTSM